MLERFRRGDFTGIKPVILDLVPLNGLDFLLV